MYHDMFLFFFFYSLDFQSEAIAMSVVKPKVCNDVIYSQQGWK